MDFAYTEPFRLLSDEGVEVGKSENDLSLRTSNGSVVNSRSLSCDLQAMRKAVYSEEVLKNCPFKVKDSTGADYTHW